MIFENIVALCADRGTNITSLEKSLGFGNGTISKWKTSSPSVDKLKLVADFFGVSVDSLLFAVGELPVGYHK